MRFSAAETAEPVWPTRELAGRPASRSPFTPPAFAGRAEKK
ncbi:hypothetical protein [Amycolatopsis arida]|nr:hypothetical protein [Amycolatopsis arida]